MNVLATIVIGMFLVGCPVSKEQKTSFTSVSKGNLFGAGKEGFKKENLVISSKKVWKSFLHQMDEANKISETFENSIDFSKDVIVVVIDEVRNTGGFSIEITEVVSKDASLLVKIHSKGPKPTDMVTMAIVQPYHIIKMTKTNKKILFVE